MKRVSFQGKGLSAGQRRQLELQRLSRPGAQYAVADFVSLREKIESRMFVGPPKPLHCYQISDEAERASYWRMVEQYSRYSQFEVDDSGTVSVAEWMGF